jgi:3-hydroxyisobutyrate dehydrogenase-like beta-hydroxyacid dehydrogenase
MLLGDEGAAQGAPGGTLFIDCTTIAPADARRIGTTLTDAGHGFVDAPVTGSAPKAEDGTLTIMCGGSDADMERAKPLLEAMGEKIVHAGEVGQGQAVKVISNSVSAINCVALAQALVVGRRADVDLEVLLEVMGSGSANSTMLQLKGKPMLEHDFSPLFKLEHMLKDIRHAIAEAKALGVELRLGALAETLYAKAAEEGHGEEDFAAVLRAVE